MERREVGRCDQGGLESDQRTRRKRIIYKFGSLRAIIPSINLLQILSGTQTMDGQLQRQFCNIPSYGDITQVEGLYRRKINEFSLVRLRVYFLNFLVMIVILTFSSNISKVWVLILSHPYMHILPRDVAVELGINGAILHQQLIKFRQMQQDQSCSHPSTLTSDSLTDNHFLLRGSQSTFFSQEVIIDFEPVKALDPTFAPQRLATFSIIPTFNNDGKYYTTAFLNPFDDQMEEDMKMLTQHQTRVREFSTEIAQNDILLPKPKSPNPFCCVCRQFYSDYLEHCNTTKHLRLMKESRWARMIDGLAEERFPKVRRSRRVIARRR